MTFCIDIVVVGYHHSVAKIFNPVYMTYRDQLLNPKWKAKRNRIILENNLTCRHCENKEILVKSQEGIIKRIHGFVRNTSESTSPTHFRYKVLFTPLDDDRIHTDLLESQSPLSQEGFYSYKLFYEIVKEPQGRIVVSAINNLWHDGSIRWKYVKGLQLHHRYYQEGAMPWEYPDDAFIPLCWTCHAKLHTTEEIRHLDKDGIEKGTLKPCHRCHGTGYFPEYNHVEDGICFHCRGAKYEQLIGTYFQ
jgi:hypothetical protein